MEKWEYEFAREKRENREMHNFLENHLLINLSLDSREAFFGGRMENIVTRYEVTKKIRYVENMLCVLYIHMYFLLGQPTIYIEEQCSELIGVAPNFNFDSVESIVQCTILPPRDLFYPVLQGKLLFGLCRSCCETFSQTECTHALPADREFVSA